MLSQTLVPCTTILRTPGLDFVCMYYGRSLGEAAKASHTLSESTLTSVSTYIKYRLFIVIGVRLVSLVVGIYAMQGAARGWPRS